MPDVALFPDNVEWVEPKEVVHPVMRSENSYQDCNGGSTERQIRFGSLTRDDNEDIVVGAVGSGAPWFLTGWAEGTEFMIDSGC